MVGPGQSYSGMVTGPFIPSRDERKSAGKGTVRQAAADMF
jgi:acetolactate synthase I/II/III large subunit